VVPAISLMSASTFGAFGGTAGLTNSGIFTTVRGNVGTTGVSTSVTGFNDAGPGCVYTETPLDIGVAHLPASVAWGIVNALGHGCGTWVIVSGS